MMKTHKVFKKSLLTQTIGIMLGTAIVLPSVAQEVDNTEVIQVKGVRGSLSQSMDIKRQSSGVVDAISAVDMGKFPDTNLAESLQRITGVSINRVNGEGSEVTVRGFGGNFNLITLNGRQMPAANVSTITGNPVDKGSSGTSRSFDFSNIASEGVSGIEVYKTGQAATPSGGIGATININTIKPLAAGENRASVGVKAVKDEGGDGVTPEISGLTNWVNDEGNFGISLFGSFQERNSGSRHASVEQFQLREWAEGDLENFTAPGVEVINPPTIGQIVAIPSNIGLGVNEDERERTNAMLTVQFAPMENLTLTADVTYAKNEQNSKSLIDGVWFSQQFNSVEFDGNPVVSTPVKFSEDIDGGKDFFFQNLALATKDELKSFGFNADFWVNDSLNLRFDAATSNAKSGGNGPLGNNAIRFNLAGSNAGWQAADFTTAIPQASIVIDDILKGNNNGIFDKADIGSQVVQTDKSNQETDVDQLRFDGEWANDDITVDFGVGYLKTEMRQTRESTSEALGGWGVGFPGDIPEGLFDQSCTACAFEDHDMSGVAGADSIAVPAGSTTIALGSVSFSGDPVELLREIGPLYGLTLETLPINGFDDNLIEEDILSAYVQINMDYEIGDMPLNINAGLRYEQTDVTSTSFQIVPLQIVWESDNDFRTEISDTSEALTAEHDYSNLLPSLDLTLDVTDEVKARASFSKTLARPAYNQLFNSTTVSAPGRPTALGGIPSGNSGNARLDPLESTNIDLSLEYYYSDSSVISIGYYRKDVKNFTGIAQATESLFGLLDASSNQAGTLAAQAADELATLGFDNNERNLFTMTAILQNPDAFPEGAAEFDASQSFADSVFGTYDVFPEAGDPLLEFQVTRPVNNNSAVIDGFEFAWQHFFGDSGFGYQANYTTVDGDIGFDVGGAISVDQFALEGLSDTANLVLIYEKDGLSTRIAYNWRDEFLSRVNRGSGPRNPLFVDSFEQLDINVSYDISDDMSVSLDVINLTEEGQRQFGRSKNNVFFVQEADRRFVLSASYNF
ncbi:TonB-dependent receptor [Paraglaciecola sp. MB-3u-78]|uniref:TonB-dependent receptor n=1 Tax=Paraglaciecola sp. MB-3u-78 TaxID=2058332 RepID=UPI000C323829|nr:TonB-dependent receptor [Paraglaciecola sp. MB-3u-78]PKG98053.1 TonB-dependent receptor [Paraglaciecola sp. MB-3u-78]